MITFPEDNDNILERVGNHSPVQVMFNICNNKIIRIEIEGVEFADLSKVTAWSNYTLRNMSEFKYSKIWFQYDDDTVLYFHTKRYPNEQNAYLNKHRQHFTQV